jgi:hypothetical protein
MTRGIQIKTRRQPAKLRTEGYEHSKLRTYDDQIWLLARVCN